jgi:RNA polymerase sigma factor (sigma-70 family)
VAEDRWPAETLVASARDGDVASTTELVEGAHPHVRRFAHSLCATPEDAEDAAQEALIILYQKIGTLRASAALASWMFRIVRNECLRRSRAVLRPRAAASPEISPSAEDDVIARLEAARVAAVVAALPADQRRVLIMRDIQGLRGHVVAHSLGISTSAMKSRLHRARTTVHDTLVRTDVHDA